MSETIATNIRLPEEMLKALKYRAFEERKSMNRLVRKAVDAFLTAGPGPESPAKDPMEEIIGIGRSGSGTGSPSMIGTSMEKSDGAFPWIPGPLLP